MPTRRTSSRRRSRRLSGGDLKQYNADKKVAIAMNTEGFHSGGRFYQRGEDNKYRCVENCGKPRKKLSQSKAAKAERKEERKRRSRMSAAKKAARQAAAVARKRMSADKKAAALKPCKEYQTRNAKNQCVGRKPCKEYQRRNEKGNCVGRNPEKKSRKKSLMGGRKIRIGPRGGKYVLKGGKKVYL